MILISHRGNLEEKKTSEENKPSYINKALDLGYDVEVDVWEKNGELFLGHDQPQYLINKKFLENKKIWCHAKNSSALCALRNSRAHYYWHENDKYTLTSKGFVWVYPGEKILENSICVLPKLSDIKKLPKNILGVCSDFIAKFK